MSRGTLRGEPGVRVGATIVRLLIFGREENVDLSAERDRRGKQILLKGLVHL